MTYLYLSKSKSNENYVYWAHNSDSSLVEKMLKEKLLSAIAYNTEEKVFFEVKPIVTSENKVWIEPSEPLKENTGDFYVNVDVHNMKNSDGLYILVKSNEDGEQVLFYNENMNDFRELYLVASGSPGPIETLVFVDFEKSMIQELEITFKGLEFQITPVRSQ